MLTRQIYRVRTLPSGWQRAETQEGLVYYIDHSSRTTRWSPPLASDTDKRGMQLLYPLRNIPSDLLLVSLPPGWEESVTEDGLVSCV
jgi:hypothetical protein